MQEQIDELNKRIEVLEGMLLTKNPQYENSIREIVFNNIDLTSARTQVVTDSRGDTSTVPAALDGWARTYVNGRPANVGFKYIP